ncbi:MAG: hypothetical protein KA257_03150 [Opitutaceae bacterium]|nr:hypothetical protein [Opitutaceae bacterium]MBP9912223.1 hypothetical protein [Opitutaceae bacterium]
MKIRTAIFMVYVAASAVGLAVLMRFMLAEVRPRYVTSVRLSMQEAVETVARALQGRTPAEAGAVLARKSSFRVKLLTPAGRSLFDSQPDETSELTEYSSRSRETVKRVGMDLIDGERDADELEVLAEAPVNLAGGEAARLVFSRSFRSVNAVIWAERRKLAGIALLIAGVMVAAGWWISVQLTRSLERLTVYAQGVRDGRAVAPPRSRAQEVAALAKAFEEMRDSLEGRQHAERYTQALAHEVKAPLAAIRGAAELLGEEMPEAQRAKFLGNIRSEAARIQQIVERLLELSSVEARKALQQTERLAGAALAQEAAAVVQPAYAAKGVRLTVSAAEVSLQGERVLLREALVNLLQNALDFSPAGSEVRLQVNREVDRIIFRVEDSGPGVPDYALSRVFERFYSLPRPGQTRKSTGLGLALVQEIAHLHGGAATLANRPGGGASAAFWVQGSA